MIWPSNFLRFSFNTSLSGRIYLWCPSLIAAFARLNTSSFGRLRIGNSHDFAEKIFVVVCKFASCPGRTVDGDPDGRKDLWRTTLALARVSQWPVGNLVLA